MTKYCAIQTYFFMSDEYSLDECVSLH